MTGDEYLIWSSSDFVKMRNLIVSRLTMFNARRGGEPAPNVKDHAVGWQCFKAIVKMVDVKLEKPELLAADKFRQRISTLYAVLELPSYEREIFYRHIGHSGEINKNVYQCPFSIGEIVKVG
ncbi:hypothetical protein RRG08_003133 [Elysia crispata]|uniref:Uncharacterized protein n=1 Tax=Elysia crispata TaxID=231223 RepID=A0AAE1ECB1_9GAST|nr:hypothetical protein RRG08_003133 [Elysia crispata]